MKVVTPEQMRIIDKRCEMDYNIPSILLMEHAGEGIAQAAMNYIAKGQNAATQAEINPCATMQAAFNSNCAEMDEFGTIKKCGPQEELSDNCTEITIVCGKGNNGGDGLAAARLLLNSGISVVVFICAMPNSLSGDSKTYYDILSAMEADIIFLNPNNLDFLLDRLKNTDILIDSLFGTGVSGDVEGYYANIINIMNDFDGHIISADIPSGIDGLNGYVLGVAIKADTTVTFGLPKVGNLIYPGREYCGELKVFDIGIPEQLLEQMDISIFQVDNLYINQKMNKRKPDTNKGTYGRVGIIAGSNGMTGAGVLAARAALRSGAGLVYNIVPEGLTDIFENNSIESVTIPIHEANKFFTVDGLDEVMDVCEKMDSIVLGPGLGTNAGTAQFVEEFIKAFDHLNYRHDKTLILDADALNNISNHVYLLNDISSTVIITPHPGEMARLCEMSIDEIQKNRLKIAGDFSKEYNVIVVLKGASTIIAYPSGEIFINSTGNPGMSTAGSGDVLAGVIAALSAGKNSSDSDFNVACGVYLHGEAGDLARDKYGEDGMVSGDIVEMIPRVFKNHK